jgi:ubiquitin-protein ligase
MYLPDASSTAEVPSPYAGRVFELRVKVKEGYPYDAHDSVQVMPDAKGRMPLYHPEVAPSGLLCTGWWAGAGVWEETWWLSEFADHLRSHLAQPLPGENGEASAELRDNRAAFEAKAKEACSELRVESGAAGGAAGGGGGSAQ